MRPNPTRFFGFSQISALRIKKGSNQVRLISKRIQILIQTYNVLNPFSSVVGFKIRLSQVGFALRIKIWDQIRVGLVVFIWPHYFIAYLMIESQVDRKVTSNLEINLQKKFFGAISLLHKSFLNETTLTLRQT